MKIKTRNYLLTQVSIVLNECHKLVSQLSLIVLEEGEDCQEVPEEVKVCREVLEEEVKVCQSTQLPMSEIYNDYWWDDSVSKLSQFSAESYSLLSPPVYTDPLLTQLSESNQSESIMSSPAENHQSTSQTNANDDKLIDDVLSVISWSSPNDVYNNKWREKRLDNVVDLEFREMWRNSLKIFFDQDEVVPVLSPPPPVTRYPTIDLTNVDSRRIAHVPKPQSCAVLGCSDDPNFYERISWDVPGCNYWRPQPHGSKHGYVTVMGVVTPPTTPVHGYVWSDTDGWVLNAVKPPD